MKAIFYVFLSALSGFLFLSPWFLDVPGFISLVSLVPFLWAEDYFSSLRKRKYIKTFGCAFLCFMVISFSSTAWLTQLLTYWAVLFFIFNSALYSFICVLFSYIKNHLGKAWGYASFVILFTAFEFLYYKTDFAFPTIIGGVSAFNGDTWNIQWYEYTGVLGGTVWVLTSNVLFFMLSKAIVDKDSKQRIAKICAVALSVAVIPSVISYAIYRNYDETSNPASVLIVQPNLDPYTVKFSTDRTQQLNRMIYLAEHNADSSVDFIVCPETAIAGNIWENNITENPLVLRIYNEVAAKFPNSVFITGADVMKYYIKGVDQDIPSSSRLVDGTDNIYYELYNSALSVSAQNVQVYKKSKLVLGTEYIPFMATFPKFADWFMTAINHGNLNYGRQKDPTVFDSGRFRFASAICFESLFGDYCAQFSKLGSGALFVITNDGWWNGSIGPEQHKRFSQIRAVECRRDVVRCGNTGISAFINQRGDVTKQGPWWKECCLSGQINMNYDTTFYAAHGNWVGLLSLILCFAFPVEILRRKHAKKTAATKKNKKK